LKKTVEREAESASTPARACVPTPWRKKRLFFHKSCIAYFSRKGPYKGKTNRRINHQRKQSFMFSNLISHERMPAHRDDSIMSFGPRRGGFINAADRRDV
jgi:hypothetical protein